MTTLNPSDKGTFLTLSGGDLTASNVGAVSRSVRATTSALAGKLYFETTIVAKSGSPTIIIGFADSGFPVSTYLSAQDISAGYGEIGIGLILASSAFGGGAAAATSLSVGDIVGCAIDFDRTPGTALAFFAVNNVWQNSADPTTGAGAFSATTASAIFPAVTVTGDGSTPDTVTVNFGGSALAYSPPSGFSSWDVMASSFGYPRIIVY
jgi:hypothetical protein